MSALRWAALGCGVVFGLGLAIAQMTTPAKIVGFLNVTGDWDPSLVVVLGCAVGVTLLGFLAIERGTRKPSLERRFEADPNHRLDGQIVLGSVLFGAGWGLSGYCPGPGIVALARLAPDAGVFVGCFIVGSALGRALQQRTNAGISEADAGF